MSSRLEDLAPDAQGPIRMFLNNLAAQGIRGIIPQNGISTSRTHWEQFVTWLQGRSSEAVVDVARQHVGFTPINAKDASAIVTKADGINSLSNHQSGRAIDWVPLRADGTAIWYPSTAEEVATYKKVAEVARACGLSCGQDWEPKDPNTGLGWDSDHYELPPAQPKSLGVAGSNF